MDRPCGAGGANRACAYTVAPLVPFLALRPGPGRVHYGQGTEDMNPARGGREASVRALKCRERCDARTGQRTGRRRRRGQRGQRQRRQRTETRTRAAKGRRDRASAGKGRLEEARGSREDGSLSRDFECLAPGTVDPGCWRRESVNPISNRRLAGVVVSRRQDCSDALFRHKPSRPVYAHSFHAIVLIFFAPTA